MRGLVLATPNRTHVELALATFSAGKAVLVEKPRKFHLAEPSAVVVGEFDMS